MSRSGTPAGSARRRLAVLVASGLGSGFSPLAPGTVGSLVALLPGLALGRVAGLLPLAILLACVAGLWAIPRASGGEDHGWVVIDEVVGQWITLLALPSWRGEPYGSGLLWVAAAFLAFRMFDISKPGPIGRLDRRHDAVGVMGDDVLAGLAGAALLWTARLLLRAVAPP